MRMPSCAFVLVPLLLLLACDREPVAPDVARPLFSATHGDFVAEGTEDFSDYVSCANDGLGEWIHWSYSWRIPVRYVTSASGNEMWRFSHAEYDDFQMVGLTSGDVWTLLDVRISGQNHYNHNDMTWGRNTVWQERFENEDGDRMFLQTTLHITVANGEWRVLRVGINACSLH